MQIISIIIVIHFTSGGMSTITTVVYSKKIKLLKSKFYLHLAFGGIFHEIQGKLGDVLLTFDLQHLSRVSCHFSLFQVITTKVCHCVITNIEDGIQFH